MKRPEGFDPQPHTEQPAAKPAKRPGPRLPARPSRPNAGGKAANGSGPPETEAQPRRRVLPRKPANPSKPAPAAADRDRAKAGTRPRSAASIAREAERQRRRELRERRRYEREEVRRFTRRARNRRIGWLSAGGVFALLLGAVAIGVYSPLLALTRIEVSGASAVDPEAILDAVDGQLGTPLALLDRARLTEELAQFSLIQSYVAETVPPGTLVLHITERSPVAGIITDDGFTVVDPAGVVIERTDVRPPGIPAIELGGGFDGPPEDSPVFDSVVEVLLAMPAPLLAQVDRITAETKDDVTLVFAGSGQRAVWGSADRSDLKARVLERLMATQGPDARVEYDVSAPLNVVVRPL